MDQNTAQIIATLISVGIVILVGFPIHEFSHAWAAFRLGDSTARYQGRLTLDPRAHIDPLGAAVLAISAVLTSFFIGWAKPTPVNPYNLQYGRRGESLVALAGPVSNAIMAGAVAIPVRVIGSDLALMVEISQSLPLALTYNVAFLFVVINAFLFFFNLLPIPPLDGWKVLIGLVDARLAYSLRQVEQYGFLLLIAVIFLGRELIGPLLGALVGFFVGNASLLRLPL